MNIRILAVAALTALGGIAQAATAQPYEHRDDRHEHRRERFDDGRERREVRHDRFEDRRDYREGYRDARRFDHPRYGAYAYPRGYAYRRYSIDAILPGVFLESTYWFNDYGRFGYRAPPYGFRWVRYGPDLVLVNVRTGRIRDVRYGAFG